MSKKTPEKLPYWRVFPGDVAKDLQYRACGRVARSVWFDVMNILHESEERGVAVLNGRPLTHEELAALAGGDFNEALVGLRELIEKGAFSSRKNGAIYSRRMVREEEKRRNNKRNGALGGNPKLVNQPVIPPVNQNREIEIEISPPGSDLKEEGGAGGESTPRGSVNHPVIQALRKTNPRIRWVALEQGIEPPARVADTMAAVDRMVEQHGVDAVVAALAAAGGVSVAEARTQANRALAKQAERKNSKENLGKDKYATSEF